MVPFTVQPVALVADCDHTAPDCTVTSPTGSTLTSYTVTTTTLTLVNVSATGNKYTYHCIQ